MEPRYRHPTCLSKTYVAVVGHWQMRGNEATPLVIAGTFFSTEAKKQFEIQNVGNFTVIIDFVRFGQHLSEQWSTDVTSNRDTRQVL